VVFFSEKKVSRRKYVVAAGGAVAVAAVGGAAYYLSQLGPTPATPKAYELIKWDKPDWETRLTNYEVGKMPDHWIQRFPELIDNFPGKKGMAAIGGYVPPEGWEKAVKGVEKITFLNYGGLPGDPAIEQAMCRYEDLFGIRVEAIAMEELSLWMKTLSILTAHSDAIDIVDYSPMELMSQLVGSGFLMPCDFLWPKEILHLYDPIVKDLHFYKGTAYATSMCMKPYPIVYRPSWLKKATGSSEPPQSWLESVEVAKQCAEWAEKNLGKGYTGMSLAGKDHRYMWNYWFSALRSQGGSMCDSSGRMNVTTPEWHNTFEVFVDYVRTGGMTTDALGWSWTDSPEMFGKGKAAMCMCGSSDLTFYEDPDRYGAIQGDWEAMPPWPYDKGMPRATATSAANFSVNPFINDNQKAAALLWMDLYRSYEVQWNEAFFEGNECYVSSLYEKEENRKFVNFPEVRAETLKAMAAEILPPNADTALKFLLEYYHKACLGEISVDEALSSAQDEIDLLQ